MLDSAAVSALAAQWHIPGFDHDDLQQEIHLASLAAPDATPSYLFRTGRNHLHDISKSQRTRKRGRGVTHASLDAAFSVAASELSPEDTVVQHDLAVRALVIIRTWTPIRQRIVIDHVIRGMSLRSIASREQLPLTTVARAKDEALATLRAALTA